MKTKRNYICPQINQIQIDNEISLILSSLEEPIFGPGESISQTPDYFNHDDISPFT